MRSFTLILSLSLPVAIPAAELIVPLQFPYAEVERHAATALGMDETGRVTIERNACSRARLSDLMVEPDPPRAWVSVAFDADLGTRLFGRCVGAKRALGRLHVLLEPEVAGDDLGVVLTFASAELRRPDGSSGLLTRPARLLAERVVLPRLEDLKVDLSAPLHQVDELIASFAGDEAPLLADRSRLHSVTAGEAAVQTRIALELAAPDAQAGPRETPLSAEELVRWQRVEDELDGFLTAAIIELASATDDHALQLDLLGALLDARLLIAQALIDDSRSDADPIRDLFIDSWDQLRPAVLTLQRTGDPDRFPGLRLTTFMAGADAIAALDALGPEYGIEISRDGIRRLARMLLADDTPVSFTPLSLAVDPALKGLLGLEGTAIARSRQPATSWLAWLIPAAHASEDALLPPDWRGFVPGSDILDDYLTLVSDLLRRKTDERLAASARLPDEVVPMFKPLVLATAWKESCWRHYLNQEVPPDVIRSPIGAIGMMQINGRVWRGVYDLDRLEREIDYNTAAGIEILEHYLVHYALRRGEHRQPGGLDNLPPATYAAYNGGPRHLSRYRQDTTSSRLKAIDRAFLEHFQRIRTEGWPEVASCYARD